MDHPPRVFFRAGSPGSLALASPMPAVYTGHGGLLGIWKTETLAKFNELSNYRHSKKWSWEQGRGRKGGLAPSKGSQPLRLHSLEPEPVSRGRAQGCVGGAPCR